LLLHLGQGAAAAAELRQAAGLAPTERERRVLLDRAERASTRSGTQNGRLRPGALR